MARLSARQRRVRSRRLKQLTTERDELLTELGDMALDMTRHGEIHREYLEKGAAEVSDLDREIAELERSLGLVDEEPEEPSAGPPVEQEPPAPVEQEEQPPPEDEPEAAEEQETRVRREPPPPPEPWVIREVRGERPLGRIRRVWAPPIISTAVVLALGAVLVLLAYSNLRSDAEREARAGAPAERQQADEQPERETITTWPAGQSGWTVSIASAATEEEGRALAQQAVDRGLEAGVIDTDAFTGLESGIFLVFAGIYEIRAEAEEAAIEAQTLGYADAYPLSVEP